MREIPIAAAQAIAEAYGYDQIIVIGRKVGAAPDPCGEHITTFGVDPLHCSAAARAGAALRRFMRWPEAPDDDPVVVAYREVAVDSHMRGWTLDQSTSLERTERALAEVDAKVGEILKKETRS